MLELSSHQFSIFCNTYFKHVGVLMVLLSIHFYEKRKTIQGMEKYDRTESL